MTKGINQLWNTNVNENKAMHQYHKFIMVRQLITALSQDDLTLTQWSQDSAKFVACAQIFCEWSVDQKNDKGVEDQPDVEDLILGELLTMCPQLQMSVVDLSKTKNNTPQGNPDLYIDDYAFWSDKKNSKQLKKLASYREDNIKKRSLLYVCMMSTEIGSTLSLQGTLKIEKWNVLNCALE